MDPKNRLTRRLSWFILAMVALAVGAWPSHSSVALGPKAKKTRIDVLFSPGGGCADRIIEE
ncbi:MAG: hypothetical protein ACE5EC_02665, partial [Phycisphaerae bacterium]